jgi:DNA-binding GntR family transcriptional regulator
MSIDPDARRPPYLQLADILREQIQSGEIPPGRRIPSMMEIETEYGLARNTIKKAFDVLKAEGLVEAEPGRGMFVVEKSEPPADS